MEQDIFSCKTWGFDHLHNFCFFQVAGQQIIQAQPAGLQAATLRAAAAPTAPTAQQIITLPNGQQAIVATGATAAATASPQIMQIPQGHTILI